jgi:hypothetical protein
MTAATIRTRRTDGLPSRTPDELAAYAVLAEVSARNICTDCGSRGDGSNPLVLAEGVLIHVSHALDEDSRYYGAVFQAAS